VSVSSPPTQYPLDDARALVVTISDQPTAELIVAAAHDVVPNLPIIARAGTESGVQQLSNHDANYVIHPELEGGLGIVRYALLMLGYSMGQIQKYMDAIRENAYADALQGETRLKAC